MQRRHLKTTVQQTDEPPVNTRARRMKFVVIPVALMPWAAATVAAPGSGAAAEERIGVATQIGSTQSGHPAMLLGVTRDWRWRARTAFGAWSGYTEGAIGRWEGKDESHGHRWFTQAGVTPALRWRPAPWSTWFAEAGVGLNVIAPHYQDGGDRFGTTFNFGDHAGVGMDLDAAHRHEIVLRVEHFSNAGIDSPNPGANFVQLRYAARFG